MTNKDPIYLDYAATTPVDPRVIQKMNECLSKEGVFGNPASDHFFGNQAKEAVETARAKIAELIHGVARNVIFTSGATEANNLALKGVAHFYQDRGKHIITCKTEHKSILESVAYLKKAGFSISYVNVNAQGLVDIDELLSLFRKDTILVSIMHVNNETGVVQDIESIGKMTRERGVFFHVDAAQSVGKLPLDLRKLSIDLLSFSAHKFYGPKGIGVLYLGDVPRVRLVSQLHGGGQERKLRAGTLPTHQIVGLGEACRIVQESFVEEAKRMKDLRTRFWDGIQDLFGVTLNGAEQNCVPHILNLCFHRMERDTLLERLQGLAVSYASACNAIQLEPSHVLRAMGLTEKEADRSIRFSFGRFTTDAEIDRAIQLIRTQYLSTEE